MLVKESTSQVLERGGLAKKEVIIYVECNAEESGSPWKRVFKVVKKQVEVYGGRRESNFVCVWRK